MKISRRNLLLSSSVGAVLIGSKISDQLNFYKNRHKIIIINADGGLDGLHLVSPVNNYFLKKYRPNIIRSLRDDLKMIDLDYSFGREDFFLNPGASCLLRLFKENTLSFVHATGLKEEYSRHSDARSIYNDHLYNLAKDKIHFIKNKNLGQGLDIIYEKINNNSALHPVTLVNHTGWDHHNNLPSEYKIKINELSTRIYSFWESLKKNQENVSIIVTTEFGRSVRENYSLGCDHGAASVMMILSRKINGGQIYGNWPGLEESQLSDGGLKVTLDSRQVLNEIMYMVYSENNFTNRGIKLFI